MEAKTAVERHKIELQTMYQAEIGQARLKLDCDVLNLGGGL